MQNWKKQLLKLISAPISEELTATGEVLKFDGFLKVYMESSDDEEDEEEAKVKAGCPI